MRKLLLLPFLLLPCFPRAQTFQLASPDARIRLNVQVADDIHWQATLNGEAIIEDAVIGMNFSSGANFGRQSHIKSSKSRHRSSVIHPAVPFKDAAIKDEYEELTLTFQENYRLVFRAYNDGLAYQFIDDDNISRNVMSEQLSMTWPNGTHSMFPREESMYSHNERLYLDKAVSKITARDFCSLPVMFTTSHGKVLLTETALQDYPGMFVRGDSSNTTDAIFPKFIVDIADDPEQPDRKQVIKKEADYIAEVSGRRDYPWRVFIISDDDRTFVKSSLAFQLAQPQVIQHTDWIKPGKVAWDWYNANNIYGVDFKAGLNTDTYKYYIDFAAKNHIEYVILDEGWTKTTTDILHFNPKMDVQQLIQYGESKGVGLILWVLWKPLHTDLVHVLETYKSWGAKGIKVDFMQRNDQEMVRSYELIAREAARLHLLVDFHGAFKPCGLSRMYPNVVNYEGVKGSENNKWSKAITPSHNVTLPFIRMAAGPMDYTPGCMSNAQESDFAIRFNRPMSLGTRAHQVAMYVVYEAPLQMLCDSPSRYYKEQETVDFITQIPTVWDETQVLYGAVGQYVVVARRKGANWYIGGMTDWSSRDFDLDLSFMGKGTYHMEIYCDGVNTDRFAEDYKIEKVEVTNLTKMKIHLAGGGGWAAILKRD